MFRFFGDPAPLPQNRPKSRFGIGNGFRWGGQVSLAGGRKKLVQRLLERLELRKIPRKFERMDYIYNSRQIIGVVFSGNLAQNGCNIIRIFIYTWYMIYEYHAMYVWIYAYAWYSSPMVYLSLHMTHDKGWTCPFYCSCWFPIGNGKQLNTVGWYTHHEWMPFC